MAALLMTILFILISLLCWIGHKLMNIVSKKKKFLPHRSIIIWSHPRSCSTILWRSLKNGTKNSKGFNEPFLLLKNSDQQPLRNIQTTRLKDLLDLAKETFKPSTLNHNLTIIKEHAFVYGQITNMDIFKKVTLFPSYYIFLIRNPLAAMISYVKMQQKENAEIRSEEISMELQWKLFKRLKKVMKDQIFLIDADELLENPETILKKMCEKFKIPFSKKMLEWPDIDADLSENEFASSFSKAAKTTCFERKNVTYSKKNLQKQSNFEIPKSLTSTLSNNIKIYRKFKRFLH